VPSFLAFSATAQQRIKTTQGWKPSPAALAGRSHGWQGLWWCLSLWAFFAMGTKEHRPASCSIDGGAVQKKGTPKQWWSNAGEKGNK